MTRCGVTLGPAGATSQVMSNHPALSPDRIAAITGAASGIGLATARRLLTLGLKVALADNEAEELAKVVEAFRGEFGEERVLGIPTDVGDQAQVEQFRDRILAEFGPVSVLMNNAATELGAGPWERYAEWQAVLQVNLWGVINGIHAFLPGMLEHGQPALVINTGSKQGITCPPGNTPYNVSKAGVKVVTEAAQHELRSTPNCKITAHLLVPGWTNTRIAQKAQRERARRAGKSSAMLPATPPTAEGAWTPEQVVERLLVGIEKNEFYILCPDNEVTEEIDKKRISWAAGDVTEGRPPLSRWHKDYRAAFDASLLGKD